MAAANRQGLICIPKDQKLAEEESHEPYHDGDELLRGPKDGNEALFMLIAQDMIELSERHNKPVEELHRLFYEVSCDRERLLELLAGKDIPRWTVLEDLALKGD